MAQKGSNAPKTADKSSRNVQATTKVDETLFDKRQPSKKRPPNAVMVLSKKEMEQLLAPAEVALKKVLQQDLVNLPVVYSKNTKNTIAIECCSELDNLRASEKADAIGRAKSLLLAERDEIRRVDHVLHVLHCLSVQKKQIQEKEMLKEAYRESDRALDQLAVADANKQALIAQERDGARDEKLKKCARALLMQLMEKRSAAEAAEDAKRLEGSLLQKKLQELINEDAEKDLLKRQKARLAIQESMKMNQESIERKKAARQADRQTELINMKLQGDKLERDRLLDQAKLVKQRQQDLETAALREAQKKAIDQEAKANEVLAQYWQDKQELAARMKDTAMTQDRAAQLAELTVARQNQVKEKQATRKKQALEEKWYYTKAQEERLRLMDEHYRELDMKSMKKLELKQALQTEIQRKAQDKVHKKQQKVTERLRVLESMAEEQQVLNKMKQERIAASVGLIDDGELVRRLIQRLKV